MSEIFSRLRNRATQTGKIATMPTIEPVDSENNRDFEESSPEAVESSALADGVSSETLEVRNDTHFNLAAADQRIRSVLDPLTQVGDQYRLLRTKLAQMQKEKGIRTLLVTSSMPKEGKTFTACCLAGIFAQEPGKRVLLIDADLRKPRTGPSLGINEVEPPAGLSQVLRGEKRVEDVLLSSSKMEFFLLPAGPVPEDPADVLSSPNLERTIKKMAKLFHWIVVDSPPILELADAPLLAALCDATLLVVRAGKTPAKIALESVQKIGKERICGIVINRSKGVRSSKYYYYSYYRKQS